MPEDPVAAAQSRNRKQMLAIIGIALVSLGGAYLLFYAAKQSGGWGTTNHGAFVEPPLSTAELGWQVEAPQEKWWIWVVTDRCGDQCLRALQDLRALHVLLNRNQDRVRRGITGLDGPVDAVLAAYPKMADVRITDANALRRGIYLVDPLGNLVLHYPLGVDPEFVLEDLRKLLKLSQIG